MKAFIENKILFPKYLGFMPYFWVFSLILMSGQLLSSESSLNLLNILLVIIFLKFYHDGYLLHRFILADIVIQLVIAIYFTQSFPKTGGPLFFIYTAWQIGSLPFNHKRFLRFYFLYLITILLCTLDKILQTPFTLHNFLES